MFCQKCGTKNPDNGKFCRSCGKNLSPISDNLLKPSNGKANWNYPKNREGNWNFLINDPRKYSRSDFKKTFGMIKPVDPMQIWDKKGKPVHWESAMTKLFTGIAFVVVSIVLAISGRGNGWWFWMLIPAFSCLGAGVAQIIQLKSAGKQGILPASNVGERENFSPLNDVPANRSGDEWIKDLVQSGNKSLAVKIYRETYGVGGEEAAAAVDRISAGQTLPDFQTAPAEEYVKPEHSIYDTGDLVAPPSVTEGTTRHLEMDSEGKTMTLPKKD